MASKPGRAGYFIKRGSGRYTRQRDACFRRGLCSSGRGIRAERSRGPDDHDCGDERLQPARRTLPSSGGGQALRRGAALFWRRGTISDPPTTLTGPCDPGGLFLSGNTALHLAPVQSRSGGRFFLREPSPLTIGGQAAFSNFSHKADIPDHWTIRILQPRPDGLLQQFQRRQAPTSVQYGRTRPVSTEEEPEGCVARCRKPVRAIRTSGWLA